MPLRVDSTAANFRMRWRVLTASDGHRRISFSRSRSNAPDSAPLAGANAVFSGDFAGISSPVSPTLYKSLPNLCLGYLSTVDSAVDYPCASVVRTTFA